jgi:hypothetical protein
MCNLYSMTKNVDAIPAFARNPRPLGWGPVIWIPIVGKRRT